MTREIDGHSELKMIIIYLYGEGKFRILGNNFECNEESKNMSERDCFCREKIIKKEKGMESSGVKHGNRIFDFFLSM